MKTNFYIIPFIWLILLISTGCAEQKNSAFMEVGINKEYKKVDSELWIYFYNFEKAATARGFTVNLEEEGIIGLIKAINHGNVAGLCNYNPQHSNEVVLDEAFWARSSDLKKELIVFHELGHCFLERPHHNDNNASGSCLSIMRSGTGSCLDNYNSSNRDEFLDELFFNQ